MRQWVETISESMAKDYGFTWDAELPVITVTQAQQGGRVSTRYLIVPDKVLEVLQKD